MAIQGRDGDPMIIRHRLVALQSDIEMVDASPQPLGVHKRADPPDAVGAAHRLSQPDTEEVGTSSEFQSVQATHPCPKQNRDGLDDGGGRDTRFQAPVHDAVDDSGRELENFLRISDQAAENSQAFLFRKRFHCNSETSSINCRIF
jgi:hypothetical protein